jgi:hypothetical protein
MPYRLHTGLRIFPGGKFRIEMLDGDHEQVPGPDHHDDEKERKNGLKNFFKTGVHL